MSYEIKNNQIISTTNVDLSYIQDSCLSATGKEITKEEASEALTKMPESIIYGIIEWDESDTVVRDNIFEWFENNPPSDKENKIQKMRYINVIWNNDIPTDPKKIISEIDIVGHEQRRINVFEDGSFGLASEDFSTLNTELSEFAIPSLEDINKNKEFNGAEITKDEFEKLWNIAKNS